MTKREVTTKKLKSKIIMPVNVSLAFTKWLSSLGDDASIQIENPAGNHGLCGRKSNNSKEAVKRKFLLFVDLHSQPNGRQAGSYGPQFYFDSAFTRFDAQQEILLKCANDL